MRALVILLAVTCAVTSSNIYLLQPVLDQVAHDFAVSEATAGLCATSTQIGYAAGILLLVPLGDRLDRRPLILALMGLTTLALAAAASAPNITWLVVASAAIGLLTPVPQLVLPLGVALSGQGTGRVVGVLQAGLLTGLLASRAYAGVLGQFAGWRQVYWCSVVLMVVTGLALVLRLPSAPGTEPELRYGVLLRSLPGLFRDRGVAGTCLAGALVGCAFGAFWNTLSFVLARNFGFGPAVIGLFGLVAASSAMTSPMAGRLADRRGARTGQVVLITTVLAGWLALLVGQGSVWWFVVGTVLLDVGVWGNQVVSQALLFSRGSAEHSRLNTIYFVTRFLGIAAGSGLGTRLWGSSGWGAVAACGLLAAACALPIAVRAARREPAVV